ncbi:MAG: winged helix DNA-binding domain-containing protein [Chloroflexaceae bacterium]|nr:winged helix DNA-binding domain-containing protein [Chloroflexaceae bacterium]
MATVITRHELNRTLLARQLLLTRCTREPIATIEQLGGLQAQIPNPPYIGLWTRLEAFQKDELTKLITSQHVVRAAMYRSTLHLVAVTDHQRIRPVLQPALERALSSFFGKRAQEIPVEQLVAVARTLLADAPRTTGALRQRLLEVAPDADGDALAYAVRTYLPLIQVPPAGTWGSGSGGAYIAAEQVLDPTVAAYSTRELFHRYLAAFGPASIKDFQAWSGLTKLQEQTDPLTEDLLTLRDERGTLLYDLPDAPRLPADTPAPIRYIPEYDNLILAHADRTRILAEEHKRLIFLSAARVLATVLIDGFAMATWKVVWQDRRATLTIRPFAPLPQAVQHALIAEGEQLLSFITDHSSSDAWVEIMQPA